ncbi:hypothetical protein MNBD_CHLOROFLEXI01-1047, partial [hydrothermal vent metagenome]
MLKESDNFTKQNLHVISSRFLARNPYKLR